MYVPTSLRSLVSVLIVLLVKVTAESDDTCNRVSNYLYYKGQSFDQITAATPEVPLNTCNSGVTCCTPEIEEMFLNELDVTFKKNAFNKDYYAKQLEESRSKIVVYMTQMLTMARKVNSRTSVLVAKFLDTSDKELIGIDKRPYPQSVLVDIAESYGLTDLLWEDESCIREMMDYLVKLGELQVSGLTLARLLYRAIPEGVLVLEQMKNQTVSDHCRKEFVRAHRCNFCKDSTAIKVDTCQGLCLDVAKQCFSHLIKVADTWEEYASLTSQVMDSLDRFSKIYEEGLSRTIKQITTKLNDHDTADMCGYDVASNLARRHKRSEEESQIRDKLFNNGFMEGMLGDIDQTHCRRFAAHDLNDKCWNGTSVGPYTGEISVLNDANITEGLRSALLVLGDFNKEFKAVNSVKLEEIYNDMDSYNLVTDQPDFVADKSSSAREITLSLTAALFLYLPLN